MSYGWFGESGIRVSSSRSDSVRLSSIAPGCGREARRLGVVVGRQVAQQVANEVEGVLLTGGDVVQGAGLGHVRLRAAEFLHADVLAGDGLDDIGTGDEHLAGLVDHDDEVGQRGGVDVATGRRTHDQRDLRDHTGGQDIVAEDPAVEAE
jgi:hypothetical protein